MEDNDILLPEEQPEEETPVLTEEAPQLPQEQPETLSEEPVAGEKPKKKGKAKKILLGITAAVVVIAMIFGGCMTAAWLMNRYWHQHTANQLALAGHHISMLQSEIRRLEEEIRSNSFTGNGNSVSGTPNTSTEGMTPGQVFAKTVDSVVTLSSIVSKTNSYGEVTQGISNGTGFILTENGYLATNYHVVENASKITVTTYAGDVYEAQLVGYDDFNDFAVLKVEATGLKPVKLGSSHDLIVGDQVVAIGNALGKWSASLSVGYISGKDRPFVSDKSVINMLQTDAVINPGNSGGPLFNMKGEVVGITTAKYYGVSSSGVSFEGLTMAIPIDDVAKKLEDLITYGYLTGAYLGVMVTDIDPDVLDAYGFPRGAYVSEVVTGNCAKEAGVQVKDMIIAVGEYKVDSVNGLTRALQNFKGGDKTTVTVWRAGAEIVLDIVLDERPAPSAG